MIVAAANRGATVAQVRTESFDRWVDKMRRHEKVISTYVVDCNPDLRSYFVNSQGEALYYRPQTISGAVWFSRFSSLGDYWFKRGAGTSTQAPASHEISELERVEAGK